MKWLLILSMMFAMTAAAAEISGTWKGVAEGPQGKIERTFVFKQAGTKLTGETTSDFTGKSVINDGKVEGDNISFTITANVQGNEMKLDYKGKVAGDEIKLKVETADGGFSVDYVAKKVN